MLITSDIISGVKTNHILASIQLYTQQLQTYAKMESHYITLRNKNMNKQSIDAILERRQQQYQQAFEQIQVSTNDLMQKRVPQLLKEQQAIQTYINLTQNKTNDKFKALKDEYLDRYNNVITVSNKVAIAVTQLQNQVNNALKSDLQMQLSNYGANNLFINIMNKQQYEIHISNQTEISRLLQELANEKNRVNILTKQYQQLQNLHATMVGQSSTEQSRLQENIIHQRSHLTNEIQKHKEQIVEYQLIIQKLNDQIQLLTKQNNNQQQSISNLQHNNEVLKQENQQINDEYIKLKNVNQNDNIETIEKHSEQLKQLMVEIQNLKVQLLDQQNQNKRQQIEYKAQVDNSNRLREKLKNLNHRIDQLKAQHIQDIENVKNELQQEQKMLQLREGTKEHLLQQLKHFQEENSELLLKNNNLKTEHSNNKLILDDFIARNKLLQVENEKLVFQNKNLLETLTLQRNGVQKAEFLNRIQALELDNTSLKQQLQRCINSEKHERKRRKEFEQQYKSLHQEYIKLTTQQQDKNISNQESSQASSQTVSRSQSSRSQSTRSQKKRVRAPWIAQTTKKSKSSDKDLQLSTTVQHLNDGGANDNNDKTQKYHGRPQSSSYSCKPGGDLTKSIGHIYHEKSSRVSTTDSGYQQLTISQIQQQQADIPIMGDFFNIHNRNRLIFSANQYRMKNSSNKREQSHQEFRKKNSQNVNVKILNDIVVK